jgi:lysozyme
VHGIDVSKYQGDIDWATVRRSGVEFVWIKATEGANHVDSKFQQNWAGAKQAGIARGAYHFVWWCRHPHEEVAWFKANVPNDPDALPPVLDVEATPDSKSCKRTLHREEVLADMRIMLQDMERAYGKRPVIYVTVDFYQHVMHPNEFSDYPVWVRSVKHSPPVTYPGRRWAFWQYQSDGLVPGIRGKVDRNAFAGTRAQWNAWLQGR